MPTQTLVFKVELRGVLADFTAEEAIQEMRNAIRSQFIDPDYAQLAEVELVAVALEEEP